jgi:hypothetical protein
MDTQGVLPLQQVAERLSGRFVSRAAGRAAGIIAIAAALFTSLPRPVAAQCPTTPLSLGLFRVDCIREGDDGGRHVEPYVVIYIADLSGPVPRGRIAHTPVLRRMDRGETLDLDPPVQLWGFDVPAAPIPNPDDLIFLVQMMEHDRRTYVDIKVNWLEGRLNAILTRAFNNRLPTEDIARLLSQEMYWFLGWEQIGRRGEDRIGRPVDLGLDRSRLDSACRGEPTRWDRYHQRGSARSGPQYRTHFMLRR